jgi:PAS domain S-box-containing protein
MSNAKQTRRVTSESSKALLHMIETLPDAVFVIDNTETIVYANASAQTLTGTKREEVCGTSLGRAAPHLVSTSLYQAVQKAKQTREPTDVAYMSPVTNTWLHVSLSPTDEGLALLFQEPLEPLPLQDGFGQNEQRYRDLLESVADGVIIVTPDGLILDINQRFLADAHLRREEVVGTPFTDLPVWSSDPDVQEHLRAAIARASRGETVRFEARIYPRTDLDRDMLMTITSHRDASQQVEYLICAGRDITACKHAEDELRTLVDAIPQFVWIAGPDGLITYNNQRLINYLALTLEQVEGTGWMAGVHPNDRHRVWKAWQTSIQTGVPYEVEHRLQDGTIGAYRWFLVRGVPQKDAQGTILHWVGTCTDIDEQKRAEQQLKTSEENWRVLAETVPQLVWAARPDGRLDYANQRCGDLAQTEASQALGSGWSQFLHPDDSERTLALRQRAFAAGEPFESEHRLKDGQTGAYRWFLARAMPVRDETGQIVKWFGTCTDIDDQKRIEEALRQSQKRIRALIDSNIIGIVSIEGEEEVLVEANDAWLHMTGYTQEDVRNRTLNRVKIIAPEQASLFQCALQELAECGQHTPVETEVVCKDGSRLPILGGAVLLQDRPRQIISFVLDNSARKELEQRKDDFISMASHELKTPLTSLKLQMQLLAKQLAKQGISDAAPALSRMEVQGKRLERLIAELLDVSKIQAGRLEYVQEPVDLEALLYEVAETMQQISTTHAVVVRGAVPCRLIGDQGRLEQVFTNLISNAIKYSPDAKTVEMDLSAAEEVVTIQVHDHGLGIPREQRDKIFERFYRVADPKQKAIPGLGMGLYIVAEIVKRHGGTITVDSAVGKGSTFTVTLPRNHDA